MQDEQHSVPELQLEGRLADGERKIDAGKVLVINNSRFMVFGGALVFFWAVILFAWVNVFTIKTFARIFFGRDIVSKGDIRWSQVALIDTAYVEKTLMMVAIAAIIITLATILLLDCFRILVLVLGEGSDEAPRLKIDDQGIHCHWRVIYPYGYTKKSIFIPWSDIAGLKAYSGRKKVVIVELNDPEPYMAADTPREVRRIKRLHRWWGSPVIINIGVLTSTPNKVIEMCDPYMRRTETL